MTLWSFFREGKKKFHKSTAFPMSQRKDLDCEMAYGYCTSFPDAAAKVLMHQFQTLVYNFLDLKLVPYTSQNNS